MKLDSLSSVVVEIAVLVAFVLGSLLTNISLKYLCYVAACILFGIFIGAEESHEVRETCAICKGVFNGTDGGWACVRCLVKIGRSYHGKKKNRKS